MVFRRRLPSGFNRVLTFIPLKLILLLKRVCAMKALPYNTHFISTNRTIWELKSALKLFGELLCSDSSSGYIFFEMIC